MEMDRVVTNLTRIDACVQHRWATQDVLMEYMSRGWQEYLNQPKRLPGTGVNEPPIQVIPQFPYHRPGGDKLPDASEDGTPAGSSLATLQSQVLDRQAVTRAVLTHDIGRNIPVAPNTHLARELARAANDYTIDRWLAQDDRLSSLILVPNQTPAAAVAEIERLGGDSRMVGVLMGANGLARPFGHPAYHEIYRAAAEWELPIVITAGADAPAEALTHSSAGGLVATYAEYHIFQPQSLMTHIVSMIVQGVFAKFPDLKVLLAGGGVGWVPSLFWRFDTEYIAYRREAPWLKRTPTELLHNNIRVTTYPLDAPGRREQLLRLLTAFGGMEDLLIYGGGYPNWDADSVADVQTALPEEWHEKVFADNALEFFRWEAPSAPTRLTGEAVAASEAAVGAME
jgi:predicted TIM-barrel fold metal-dependent hydrolase